MRPNWQRRLQWRPVRQQPHPNYWRSQRFGCPRSGAL